MSRFSDILKGTRAIRRVECPIVNTSAGANADSTDVPSQFVCGVRVLKVEEQETVYKLAMERAKQLGSEEREDSHIYNLALQEYTIAAAYVDPDSDPAKPILYFGDTIEQAAEAIRASELLSRDVLAYLAEVQEVWQDWCNPQKQPAVSEMYRYIEETAKDATFPLSLRPGVRLTFMHTMANLLVNSQNHKSSDSLPSISKQKIEVTKPQRTIRSKKALLKSKKR